MGKKKTASRIVYAGFDLNQYMDQVKKIQGDVRIPVTFKDLPKKLSLSQLAIPKRNADGLPMARHQLSKLPFKGVTTTYIRIFGGAGEEGVDIPQPKLKEINDHYKPQTRQALTEIGLRDHAIAPSIDRRHDSIYEDGFELVLERAAKVAQNTSTEVTQQEQSNPDQPMQQDQQQPPADSGGGGAIGPGETNTIPPEMEAVRQTLQAWCDDNDLLNIMRDMDTVEFVQGKSAALISPGLADLAPGDLPMGIEVITAQDLGNPIVDVGLTRKLVGMRLNLDDKELARADELVYIVAGKQGLRREGKFQGISKLEVVTTVSKILRRIYDLDYAEAVIAAYITKIIFKVAAEGDETEQRNKIQNLIQDFFKMGKIAFGVNDQIQDIKEIKPAVDWQMLQGIKNDLTDLEIGLVGPPKSFMNKTDQVTRDMITVQAIAYKRFVVKPIEKHLAANFENQLINPLFAHLLGKKLSDVEYRLRIKKKVPEGGDIDTMFDPLSNTKSQEISQGSMMQHDAISTFGAAGKDSTKFLVEEKDGKYIVSEIDKRS